MPLIVVDVDGEKARVKGLHLGRGGAHVPLSAFAVAFAVALSAWVLAPKAASRWNGPAIPASASSTTPAIHESSIETKNPFHPIPSMEPI